MTDPLLASLRAAVAATPDDVTLRLHLAHLLDEAGLRDEAVSHAAAVLTREPSNAEAFAILAPTPASPPAKTAPAQQQPPQLPQQPQDGPPASTDEDVLRALDRELSDVVPQMFVSDDDDEPDISAYQGERAGLTLADVGGMTDVKARLEASFLAPLRNPQLREMYRMSLRGGLLLYGPPGCGKTMIARAMAGELGAQFLSVSLADILDVYVGQSERNVHELFEWARRNSPCVVFLDEVDAIGLKRSQQRNSASRGTVNQLLTEMDGIAGASSGDVFVLGATNHPWDVDVALRRPGRFDRMTFVGPPDREAREAILRLHLRDRPVMKIDLTALAKSTDGFSGADLAYVCDVASQNALIDSARSGNARMIEMNDLKAAVRDVRPSTGPWLDVARNVAQFANEGGSYDELVTYLRKNRLL